MPEPLRHLVEAAPDAVVVVDQSGRIVLVNDRVTDLLGFEEDELVGAGIELLLPDAYREGHAGHRARYMEHPTMRPMGAGQDLYARHQDGRSIPVDIALAPLALEQGPCVAAYIRDATARRDREAQRQHERDEDLARAQALELNDSVVQGLTAITWLLEDGNPEQALVAARETLASARSLMGGLLGPGATDLVPGELRRMEPARRVGVDGGDLAPRPSTTGQLRVVVADDSEDVRMLLRLRFEAVEDMHIVAEAGDGAQALRAVEDHLPDAILLDLAMPVIDGFEVAQRLRETHPGLRIVVLSGHPANQMRDRALACGADAYVEKGGVLEEIVTALRS
jgi:PAS domain S-box-containing protein